MADSNPITLGGMDGRSQADWERAARDLLDEGQNFLAHDIARNGLKRYPESLKLAIFGAVALSQSGALDEARKLLQPVLDEILIDEGPFHRLFGSLKKAVESLSEPADKRTLSAMAELAEALELVRGKKLVANADAETYTALAGVFREAWLATGEDHDLVHCRELFMRAFLVGGSPRAGIDAAATSWLLGDHERAQSLARSVADAISSAESELSLSPEERYQLLVTVAVAHLLLGETEEALASFAWASTLEGIHYGSIVSALKQMQMLQDGGLVIPPAVADIIKPPTVVVFTGHPLDRPGEGPHFPPELETVVRAEIARSLDELGAQIGYSMAACGSDLLFIETMLERGAEVNVVMPYALEDFIAENVRYGGSRWEMRFRNALKLANTVTYATEERYLGHGMLTRFANQCLHGIATLRANFLTTAPYLLAVWDMMPGSLVGGAADFIDQWEDISRLRIIDLDNLLQQNFPAMAADAIPSMPDLESGQDEERGEGRVIRSMMFCDIAGYSKLKEEHTPVFLDFLRIISDGMAAKAPPPIAVNTWGDAIFAVMDKASKMAEYAHTLQEMVAKADEDLRDRLPHPLSLRISLHAGPVFQAIDPICGRQNFYGSHINRAARLEPVTVIGHVYATQQFVAVLTAEQSALHSEAQNRGEDFEERFACEYVGVLSLAKDFGRQAVYHLRRRAGIPSLPGTPAPEEHEDLDTLLGASLTLDPEPETNDPAPGDIPGFSDEDLGALLAEAVDESEIEDDDAPDDEEPPLPPLVFGTVMSDDDIAALLEETEDDDDPPLAIGLGTGISDADMAAMLDEAVDIGDEDEDEDEDGDSEAAGDDDLLLGTPISDEDMQAMMAELSDPYDDILPPSTVSDDDLNALLAEAVDLGDTEEEEEDSDAPHPSPPLDGSGALSDEDLAQLVAEAWDDGEDGPLPASDAPPLSRTALSDDDLALLLQEVEDGEDDAETEENALDDLPDISEEPESGPIFGGIISDDDIAALAEEAVEDGDAPEAAPAPVPATAGEPDLSEVAAAVKAAMERLEAEDRAKNAAISQDISLAPPRQKG